MTAIPYNPRTLHRLLGAALLLASTFAVAQTAPAPTPDPSTAQPPAAQPPSAPTPQNMPPTPRPAKPKPADTSGPTLQSLPPSTKPNLGTAPAQTPAGTSPQTAPADPSAPPTLTPRPPGSEPLPDNGLTTIRVQANEVNLTFTVTDKKGHFVENLRVQDFGLLDDGVPPSRISGFTLGRDLPLRVGIMLDTSSSIRTRFQFEQQSAVEFLLQVLHSNDRAFVEGFDVQTDLSQDFSNNIDLLSRGIDRLRPGGGTAFFDALYKTCRDQMLGLRDPFYARRAIILVSDGDDNYSRAYQNDAIKMCQRAETTIYAISTNTSPSRDKGDDVLQAIANATGGRAFFPNKIEDVAVAFHNVELELRSQYALQYSPANYKADGSFRTIYLHTVRGDYTVHTRSGYFAASPAQ